MEKLNKSICAISSFLLFMACVPTKHNGDNELSRLLYKQFEANNFLEVKRLLSIGADVNYHPANTLSLLDRAVTEDNFQLVELFLKYKADIQSDSNNRNLLSYAASKEVAQLLKKHGVSLNSADKNGNLPIHWLCARREINSELLIFFLSNSDKINAKNRWGQTPLHIACLTSKNDDKYECIGLLLKCGGDANSKDNAGCTSLLYAAYHNNPRVLQMLIEAKAAINVQDNEGNSVLHGAYALQGKKNIPLLLRWGANPALRNKSGKLYDEE